MIKTVTLKTAEELKEAGFPREAYFSWISDDEGDWHLSESSLLSEEEIKEYAYAAPTAEEILEQLPFFIKTKENQIYYLSIKITMKGDRKQYLVEYLGYVWGIKQDNGLELLAEAAAKMWLYLKKEGLL
jgi:hypothetical protein